MISIIIPVYNGEKYLEACLSSIVNQTSKSFEVIIVDDGSTDSSVKICLDFTEKYDYIRLVCQSNRGVSSARNRGLEEMCGSHYMFLDCDDWLVDDAIEQVSAVLSECDADVVVFGIRYCFEDKEDFEVVPEASGETIDIIKDLYSSGMIGSPVNKVYKAKLKDKKFEIGINYAEDWRYNYNIFREVRNVISLEKCLYCYRKHGGTLSSSVSSEKIDQLIPFFYSSKIFLTDMFNKNTANELLSRHFYEYLFPYLFKEITLSKDMNRSAKNQCLRKIISLPEYRGYLKSVTGISIYKMILRTKSLILLSLYIKLLEVRQNGKRQ